MDLSATRLPFPSTAFLGETAFFPLHSSIFPSRERVLARERKSEQRFRSFRVRRCDYAENARLRCSPRSPLSETGSRGKGRRQAHRVPRAHFVQRVDRVNQLSRSDNLWIPEIQRARWTRRPRPGSLPGTRSRNNETIRQIINERSGPTKINQLTGHNGRFHSVTNATETSSNRSIDANAK